MKIRIRFSKEGSMKYIGHLDMMRYFQKAFRRANVDIEYSQGYSPHQLISFASPLGVGLTSQGEYMDIFVKTTKSSSEMIDMINKEMAEGVKILSYKQIEDETKHSNAMSLIAAADYEVAFRDNMIPVWLNETTVKDFFDQEQIMVEKKTKKSVATVDIKPMIHQLSFDGQCLQMKIACGSSANLKPDLLIETLYKAHGEEFSPLMLLVHRKDMYAVNDNQFISLDNLGQELL